MPRPHSVMLQLRALREEQDRTQSAVAARLGVTAGCVNQWESGHRTPSLHRAAAYAEVLGARLAVVHKRDSDG